MTVRSGLLALICLILAPAVPVGAEAPAPQAGVDTAAMDDPGCKRAAAALALQSGDMQLGTGGADETDVQHYFLDIEIIPEMAFGDFSAVRIEGTSTIDVHAAVDGLDVFHVDLRDNLTVTDVTGDVSAWTHVNDVIEITLDQTYNTGEAFQVTVAYEGYPQTDGFGAFRWWTRGDNLVIGTLSEPFFARYWWPGKDQLNDKATFVLHCTVPDGMVVGSNGLELGTAAVPPDRTKYMWHETYPMIPYLLSLAITNYERYDLTYEYDHGNGLETMPVPCYLYPDHWDFNLDEPAAAHKAGCDELLTMLATLEPLYGPYPFIEEKYGVAETGGSGGLGANMEHQTLSSMYRVNNYTDVMMHELAHQWWGDDVTCETWHDIWLNEGFATFSECLYRQFKPGGSIGAYLGCMAQHRPGLSAAQVYRNDVGSVGAIFTYNDVYLKGSWVVHMLRHVLGDAVFFDALADYRAAFGGDSATTAEFTTVMSDAAGFDLAWFVDQWVMQAGAPAYRCGYRNATAGGQDYVVLEVAQFQDDFGHPLMVMPLDIRVTTANSTQDYVVWSIDALDRFALPTDGPAQSVALDPDGWVLTLAAETALGSLAPPICQGDMNEDGAIDGRDIQPMVDAVLDADLAPWSWQRSDLNFDGRATMADVGLFADALLGPVCPQ